MSLRRIKTLYCLAVIAIGVLLAALGGWVGWLAAVLVLGGALPGWKAVERTFLAQALCQAATFLEGLRRADEASQPLDPAPQVSHS